jgi:ABC-type branched-subunit amino acid transport system permease subunit
LSDGVAAGIVVLSLVVLVGYAGELSLATMAVAGIGGTIFFHKVSHTADARAGMVAYVVAMVGTAVVGAVVALPALRLRGLYLGLATAAFSVGVEQMVFKEFTAERRIYPLTLIILTIIGLSSIYFAFRRRGWRTALVAAVMSVGVLALAATNPWLDRKRWSPIFPNGNLQVPRPRLLGIDFKPQDRFLLLLTVVFAVLGVGLVAVRRSSYGRRLAAMRDSPAACAMLGMNIVRLKLSVFMMSAAVAGLGGCLYAQEIGAVTGERFSLFESMTMLMLVVVAGMGYVSGGFVAGLLYGSAFVTLHNILDKLARDVTGFHGVFDWLASFTAVLPALIGIGLGRNPSGFVNDFFVSFGPMIRKVRPVFVAGVGIELLAWLLADLGVIGNWPFALFTMAWIVVLPRVAMAVRPAAYLGDDAVAARRAETPLELIGLERPFTADDLATIDRGLGLARADT